MNHVVLLHLRADAVKGENAIVCGEDVISQLKNERVEKVSDVINEGDVVKVKVLDIDSRGKVKLSMKEVEAD